MDFSVLTIIVQLIFLECILSIDNAAVLGAMVAPLPKDEKIPWPRRLRPVLQVLDPILGYQRQDALKVGLLGAYAGRLSMLLLAGLVIQNIWMQVVGAIYLIYLAVRHFGKDTGAEVEEGQGFAVRRTTTGFWSTVLMIELADLAFSLDNVIAAVALSDRLWVVILGIAIGMVLMRFAATIFTFLIEWEPALEGAAFLLIFTIGGKLLLEHFAGIEINEWVQFGISIGLILLVIIFARVKPLGHLTIIFRPFVWLCVWLNRGLTWFFGLLASLWRFTLLRVRNTPG